MQSAVAEEWQRDKRVLLTNFNNMYQPCVVETGGEYRYRMWFFGWAAARTNPGWPGCDATFHARSKDLTTWEVSKDGIEWKLLDFIAPDDDTDANHVPQAFATTIDGAKWLYLFYSTQVGHGRNDGRYLFEYDRIRAMRRRID
jgi:hypothetical protein